MLPKLQPADRSILLDALRLNPVFRTQRGRYTLISNALNRFPYWSKIETALTWVDWEGDAFTVADELLSHLEPHEAQPGIPAFAVIAQAIEPMAGSEHRDKLRDLRARLNWGPISPETEAAAKWADTRTADEVTEERILGENTLKPMYYLRRALRAADAVVRVDLNGKRVGTAFLVAPTILMTNHHVIHNEQEAQSAQFYFFDDVLDLKHETELKHPHQAQPATNPLLHTDKTLDFTLLKIENAPKHIPSLPLRPERKEINQRVAIIQHPGGYPKQISMQNNMVAYADDRIVQYYTTTTGGSSGSPVFDDDFAVVAIHHCWVHNKDWDGDQLRTTDAKHKEDLQYRNQGISMIAILDHLRQHAPDLLDELTIAPNA